MRRFIKPQMRPSDNLAPVGETHWFVANLNAAEYEAYAKGLLITNGRGVEHIGDQVTFEFDANGRFDSFTAACSNCSEFLTMFDLDLAALTDHAFVFVQKASESTPVNSAYVLGIKDRRLVEIAVRADQDVVYDPTVKVVEPRHQRRYLEAQGKLITDDTVLERMWWVDQVQKHQLIDERYEPFLVGMDSKDRWRAFDNGFEAVMSGGWLNLY